MSIGPLIPEIQHFQNLTLKIKGQGHRWGHSLKSQCGCNILSTHIPFVPCQSGIPFLSYDFFKIWPWKSKVKVMGEVTIESHNQTPQKLFKLYRTENALLATFKNFKHDYIRKFYRSSHIFQRSYFFISRGPRTGKFRGVCTMWV